MLNWILDENVLQLAFEAPCGNEAAQSAAARVLDFVQMRGRWVFTPDVSEHYLSKWRASTCRTPLTVRRFKSFMESPWDSERHLLYRTVEPVDGRFHDDDDFIVSAAAAAGAGSILVTEDGRLRRKLAELGIPAGYGFEVVDVAGALALQAKLEVAE